MIDYNRLYFCLYVILESQGRYLGFGSTIASTGQFKYIGYVRLCLEL